MIQTNNTNNKKKHKKWRTLLLAVAIVSIVCIAAFINYYKEALSPMDDNVPKEIQLEIPSGSNSSKIASILKENGLIRSEFIFKLTLKKNNSESSLKAGNYTLNTGMSLEEIINELSKGGKNTNVIRFTIPEGYELKLIAEKLAKEGLVDKDKFLQLASNKKYFEDKFSFLSELDEGRSLEGYLFPSTYEIYIGASEEQIIEKMLAEFEQVFEKKVKGNMNNVNLSLDEVVTLASIIEREAKRDDERELISAVFHNRLNINMPLQSCATVQYALGERKEVVTDVDTQIQSEFNTYIHNGLPPAPIASPGEKSLIAAVNPADVDYLYFRTKEDGTGAHTFSRTYEEHKNADPDN